MHELSIATNLVELVTQEVADADLSSVKIIKLSIGALSCVHRDALRFSFRLVTQDTLLKDSQLEIETVPVSIYCPSCNATVQIDGIQSFRCPHCQTLSGDVRAGRELELRSIELANNDTVIA